VELRHLRYFVGVAEMENVSRAALKLHVSQPALSRQIRDLEDEIGFALLERTAKSVSLTEAGRVFLNEARAVLYQSEEAVKKAMAVATASHSELHVGYPPTPTAHILPGILRAYQRAMPNVHLKLHDLSNEENVTGVREGRLHLAFVVRTPKSSALRGLRFEELTRERMCLAVSPNHPLAGRRTVSVADAAREPFIGLARAEYHYHDFVSAIFGSTKRKPRHVEEHDSVSSIISSIEAGTGVALALEAFGYSYGNRVKLLRLTPEPKPITLGIAAPKGPLTPAAEKFCQCAKEGVTGGTLR
jgi:DNA-binding transcriptional LysR family regulator